MVFEMFGWSVGKMKFFYKGIEYRVYSDPISFRWFYRIAHYDHDGGPYVTQDMAIRCAEAYIDSRLG